MTAGLKIEGNNRVFIDINILARNGEVVPVKFKFDPGADRTTISSDDLLRLGYHWQSVKDLMEKSGGGSVASGEKAFHYSLKLNLNHILGQIIPKGLSFPFLVAWRRTIETPKPECAGCSLTGEITGGFSSLLGNDILSCFEVQTDRPKKLIYLTRTSDIKERNKLYPWCEMHSLEQ